MTHDEAARLLAEYADGASWTAHCHAVADAAERIALKLAAKQDLDVESVWRLALLHDIGRYATHDPILHGVEGYHLLMALGHVDEARMSASHVLFGLTAEEAADLGLPAHDFFPRTTEERLVPLADYLVEFDTPTTLEARFASLRARNADNSFLSTRLDRAYAAASAFRAELEDLLGERVEAIVAKTGNHRSRSENDAARQPTGVET